MNRTPGRTRIMRDGREKLSRYGWLKRRREVCERAKDTCERCWGYTPLIAGEAHHVVKRGLGGGWRDDRLDNLLWLCPGCHRAVESRGLRTKMRGAE